MFIFISLGSGKSTLVIQILKDLPYFYDEMPDQIYWSYAIYDCELETLASTIPNLKLIQDLPSQQFLDEHCSNNKHNILVIDDNMLKLKQNPKFAINLATRFARHRKLSVFCISQNIFELPRTFSLNSSHMILTYPGRDAVSLRTLSSQLWPRKNSVLLKIWADIVKNSENFPYMLISCSNEVSKEYKILTKIFRHEDTVSYIIDDF